MSCPFFQCLCSHVSYQGVLFGINVEALGLIDLLSLQVFVYCCQKDLYLPPEFRQV